jgi:outer membrane scaffolding protein for murein synthesis (MipA/OmpV family)
LNHLFRRACALALSGLVTVAAHADQPLWELGAGAGTLHVPHYRGADQRHHWLLPIPYVVFRGEIFRSDRDGTRAVLLDTEAFDFDLSLDASPPLKSADSRARAGMADLAATLEIGPKLNLLLGKGPGWKLNLRVPVRAAFTLEPHAKAIGWTSTPELDLDVKWNGWNLGLQGGPLAASRRFHDYFYSVAAADATADRPAYAAPGGKAGWGLAASATRRVGDWWVAGFWRVDRVGGAAFEPSPLVKQRQNVTLGFALSWIFAVSGQRVPDSR